jgi:hypothetical protein
MKTSRSLHLVTAALAAMVVVAGCADTRQAFVTGEEVLPAKEAWNWDNAPERFHGPRMVTNLDALPKSGRADREVWPSTYWATYEDGINVRWLSSEMSPAEKYDVAFNGWVPSENFMELRPYKAGSSCGDYDNPYYQQLGPLATHVSANMGNAMARNGFDDDGDGRADECDDRDGVATWWGLCHAWVAAAMLEDRPLRAVVHNGVTFHPGDLEALIIAAYNRNKADMLGDRCNAKEVERDEHGRAVLQGCRDTNAGSFHVVMSNYIGLNKVSFAEDRTYDSEVWNQPVVAYEVTMMKELSPAQASARVGARGETYPFNAEAKRLVEVRADATYITESGVSVTPADAASHERVDGYNYILELDGDGDIIGGEWTIESQSNHPDFLWNPRRAQMSSVPHLDLEKVRELIRKSRMPAGSEVDEPDPSVGSGEELVFEDMPGWLIPDADPSGVQAEILIPEGVRGKVTVSLQIYHTFLNDLFVEVVAPTGERWTLFNHEEVFDLELIMEYVLDPQPSSDLGGTWRLNIYDLAELDEGIFEAWSITVVQ